MLVDWVLMTLVVPLSPLVFFWLFCFLRGRCESTIAQSLGDGQVIFYAAAIFASAYTESIDRDSGFLTATRTVIPFLACLSACMYCAIAFDRLNTDNISISPRRAALLSSVVAGFAVIVAIAIHLLPRKS
jgi:hypothetical protein